MGLHLNYELRLPGAVTAEEVTATLTGLREFALTLDLQHVSTMCHASPSLRTLASIIASVFVDDAPPLLADVDSVRGFSVLPGEGCETAAFAFLTRRDPSGQAAEWFWHSSCKTQYASVISDRHLVICHTSLVKLIDHAIDLGVKVTVRDETHYWENRDERRLIAEVHDMNRFVAGLAGTLRDAARLPDDQVMAPIFRHPRFEHLEMGQDE